MLKLFCNQVGSNKKFYHCTLPEDPQTVLKSPLELELQTKKPSSKKKKKMNMKMKMKMKLKMKMKK